jgi:hypothetical protein
MDRQLCEQTARGGQREEKISDSTEGRKGHEGRKRLDQLSGHDKARSMTRRRRILRLLFFVSETGTAVGTLIFLMLDPHFEHNFGFLSFLFVVAFSILPCASFALRRTDRRLATIGLLTFFVFFLLWALVARH